MLYDGNLGGLAGADAKCDLLASNAGLTGTFRAWLSDGIDSPDTRFLKAGNPYVLVDNTTVIASDWTDLTSGSIQAPINLTELGGSHPGPVFTNVLRPRPSRFTVTLDETASSTRFSTNGYQPSSRKNSFSSL